MSTVQTFQVRIHGRGGQGVVTAAELLSVAAFVEGRYAQAFPSFGSERTGAPVASFVRIADRPIRVHEQVLNPDAVIVADATLLDALNVFEGLMPHGYVLISSARSVDELGLADLIDGRGVDHVVTLPATELALEHVGRPVPNAVLLGGFAAMTGVGSLGSVLRAISERFAPQLAAGNIDATTRAYELVRTRTGQVSHA
jgi:pyruvate ferredoxin oxidoreductase gamma subunit